MEGINEFVQKMKDKFLEITFNDVVDIALIALILFFAYKFIRRRRALSVLLGVFIYALAMVVCKFLYMDATYTMLEWVAKPGMIALIVIFQSDIRSGLEKIGASIFGLGRLIKNKFVPLSVSAEADSLEKAIISLSETKTGALIVLEKSTGIEDIGQDGIKLDALITTELICNIFYAPAPLHDGAIIIRKKRITAAGCILPNYSDPSINSAYGSRHRAAIGMSRNSDAEVIVVSEEDGRISHAVAGELTSGIDREYLREVLCSYYGVVSRS